MTAILWDGKKTLAADTLCTGPDDDGVYYGTKIHRTKLGLFGGCGDEGPIQQALDWINAGAKPEDRPPPLDLKEEDLGGILVRPDGSVSILSRRFYLIDYHHQPACMGSGGQFALAFLHMGMTAREAVQRVIDLKLDINTGGKVETLELEDAGA